MSGDHHVVGFLADPLVAAFQFPGVAQATPDADVEHAPWCPVTVILGQFLHRIGEPPR